jgi:hypothetical protein
MSVKLSAVKVKVFNAASAAALDAAVNAWLPAQSEATLLAVLYAVDAGDYSVCITYTT